MLHDEWDNLLDSETGQVDMDVAKELYTKLHNIAVLTDEEIATILAAKLIQSRGHSVLWYRIRAIQALVAGHRSMPALSERLKEVMDALNDIKRNETGRRGDLVPTVTSPETYKTKAVVEFNCSCMAIPSFVGKFTVVVRRTGREDHTVFAKVDSYDGTAKKNDTYTPVSKEIIFEPYVLEHKIGLSVMGDVHKNKDMNFFLKLSLTKESHPSKVALGQMSVMEVVIMDIQQPGDITFMKKGLIVKDTLNIADLEVERVNGSDGTVLAKYVVTPGPKCTRLTEPIEGTLQFEHGEMKKNLQVPLQPSANKAVGQDEQFDVEFVEIVGGAGNIGQNPKVTVAIAADEGFRLEIERVVELAEEKSFLSPIKMQTYKEQIKSSVIVNGGREEAKHATVADKILHYLSVPWKCMFCFLPTPHALGGWPCFVLTLFVIGMLTAVVGDMATIFGYCLSLDPVTTGIVLSLVALGTSLPDTFASRIATVQDKNADAAIGNITGSNSVNVFLGLGLPWTVASIYLLPIIAQFILWLRRQSMTFGLAELGGPAGTKWLTSIILVLCWVTYVFFAIIATQIESVNNIVGSKLGQYLTITKGKYPPPDPPMV
ncbi:Sodium/calcium exchanger 3 [Orchesella cincta]|uniref:Sodium/calcium exchanger 3 n=1 Tax=Orchesella cincta TaxID=48709 RepID=A0A1D2MJU5_ORCCI|nr:Sodium/calcium exchanger 3 [Orchesella cincta]